MTTPVCFVDTETISLARDHRHLWEIALIVPDYHGPGQDLEEEWFLADVPLGEADAVALQVGRFHDRYPGVDGAGHPPKYLYDRRHIARLVEKYTRGRHLVGAVPSFDEQRLWDFLRAHGQCPGWHYHLVDVEALAAGYIAAHNRAVEWADGRSGDLIPVDPRPPWDSNQLSLAVGVDPGDFERHTALGDAKWAKAIYDAVTGGAQ